MAFDDPLQKALNILTDCGYPTAAKILCKYVEDLECKAQVYCEEREIYRKERRELQNRLDEIENPTGEITR